MRLSARSPPTRWRQRSFRRCWSAATSCSGCFQNHLARRKSRPTESSAKRKSSQRCILTSPLRMNRAPSARGTHRPSAPSRHRRLRPPRKRQTPLLSAVSNLCPASPHTIWRFNIIRASQPPISTAASSCIASAISTARSHRVRAKPHDGFEAGQDRHACAAQAAADRAAHAPPAPHRRGERRSPRP